MTISIIAAMSKNRVIGFKNKLPWKLPADLNRFKKITMGKPIIMGQTTFHSIGKPLPGRINIILTRDFNFSHKECFVAHSIEEALSIAFRFTENGEVMICGGESVYRQFLPIAEKMYLTLIEENFEGDAFFPYFDYKEWQEVERIKNEPDEKNPYEYFFITLKRDRGKINL
jgi:dihydrofolate reductase